MEFTVQTKIKTPERLKNIGEKLRRSILASDFYGDIEEVTLLQELLTATGIDPVDVEDLDLHC